MSGTAFRLIVIALIAVAITVGAGYLGLPLMLGAHPFWAIKIAWLGAPAGAVLGLALAWMGVRVSPRLAVAVILLLASVAIAHFGKLAFAASYAEDTFAGVRWYFGWIGAAAGFAAGIFALLTARNQKQ